MGPNAVIVNIVPENPFAQSLREQMIVAYCSHVSSLIPSYPSS